MNTHTQRISQDIQSNRDIKQKAYVVAVCQHCEQNYIIGVTGTVMGCDTCERISRNKLDGSIIEIHTNSYIDDEDTLTDMEKA